MIANYKPDLSCQSKFIPIDFVQPIIPDTFEYVLSHIVDKHLDLNTVNDSVLLNLYLVKSR